MGRSRAPKALTSTASRGDEARLSHARANPVKRGVRETDFACEIMKGVGNDQSCAPGGYFVIRRLTTANPSGHSKLNGYEHRQYRACADGYPLKKVEKNRTNAHSSIVQLSSRKREITMRMRLPCAQFQS